ncbi:putative methyltransferase-domain-containing protein [Auriculariales sp. MPI-PUGE-AT-0066]|nr:putative methyltransferase-domain-containing protein [Auriculariales sp. MPI-PUGE-AT-0066]
MSATTHRVLHADVALLPVTDADEEVFLLYTALAGKPDCQGSHGLGSVNSRSDRLSIEIDDDLTIELAQNTSALRSRKGDTGSVLWRASVTLARLLRSPNVPILNQATIQNGTILELGAGTGILATALYSRSAQYIATDLVELVPLIQKNLNLNDCPSTVVATAIDWTVLHSLQSTKRDAVFPVPPGLTVVLAVDTLYNPSLVPPFVSTLEHYTSSGACALVVCELRAQEVIQEFLEQWVTSERFQIYRIEESIIELPFVAWVAWRVPQLAASIQS